MDRYFSREPAGYPDPDIEVVDTRFARYHIKAAAIERLWTGSRWAEGPAWFGAFSCLIFSDIPNDRMICWSQTAGVAWTFRSPSGFANGNTRDRQGRLVTCEQGARQLSRTEMDGSLTVLVNDLGGKRLNGPNDVVVDSRNVIWFTDPGYGIISNYEGERASPELPNCVYRLDPSDGRIDVVSDELTRPNGLCFSPDEKILYLVDTGCTDDESHHRNIIAFDVIDKSRLANPRPFCDLAPGRSDGIRCDTDGNLWSASGFGGPDTNGVRIFAPDGDLIGRINLPEPAANLCFGGARRNRLFITAGRSLYSLYVEAQGCS